MNIPWCTDVPVSIMNLLGGPQNTRLIIKIIITLILRERQYPIIREQYRKSETIMMNSTRKLGKALKTLFHSVVTVNATGITSQTAERDCLINLLPNQYWLITLIKGEK